MFGGIAFLLDGHMCCGVLGSDLMLRLGEREAATALAEPHARAMDFTGRPMRSMVYVGARGIESEEDLNRWVLRAVAHVKTLPPKPERPRAAPRPAARNRRGG